jgi:hypothetical protein
MPPHKHRKFVRSEEPPGQLRIQPRDEELFRDLASYRFLDTEQIFALHPAGERNARRRLASLFHMGYLDRPVQQKAFAKQGMSLIYGLGEKGKEFFVGEFDPKESRLPPAREQHVSVFERDRVFHEEAGGDSRTSVVVAEARY